MVAVHRLTTDDRWNKHTYVDVSPWSPDGTRLAYSSGVDYWTLPARVVVARADGSDPVVVAEDGHFTRHVGCFVMWSPDGRGVYYRSKRGQAFVDLATLKRTVTGPFLRDLNQTLGLWYELGNDAAYWQGSGRDVCTQRLRDGKLSFLLSRDEAARALGVEVDRFVGLSWSPVGNRFVVAPVDGDGEALSLLVGYRPHGRRQRIELRSLVRSGHHSWAPDGKGLVLIGYGDDGRRALCHVGIDGSLQRVITADRAAYGTPGSHPSYSPDMKLIVSEDYGARPGLQLVDPVSGAGLRCVDLTTTFGFGKPEGTHFHPVWSPDGKLVLFDSDGSGSSQIYVAEVG